MDQKNSLEILGLNFGPWVKLVDGPQELYSIERTNGASAFMLHRNGVHQNGSLYSFIDHIRGVKATAFVEGGGRVSLDEKWGDNILSLRAFVFGIPLALLKEALEGLSTSTVSLTRERLRTLEEVLEGVITIEDF